MLLILQHHFHHTLAQHVFTEIFFHIKNNTIFLRRFPLTVFLLFVSKSTFFFKNNNKFVGRAAVIDRSNIQITLNSKTGKNRIMEERKVP